MRISVEKASDGTYIIEVPCKTKKDKKGYEIYKSDLKYTAEDEKGALKIIATALKEIEVPEDEYGLAYAEASKEPKVG